MDVLSYAAARAGLDAVMTRVVEDHAPVVITRGDQEAVVLVSLADWTAMDETAYLLSSPANASRLRDATAQLGGPS